MDAMRSIGDKARTGDPSRPTDIFQLKMAVMVDITKGCPARGEELKILARTVGDLVDSCSGV